MTKHPDFTVIWKPTVKVTIVGEQIISVRFSWGSSFSPNNQTYDRKLIKPGLVAALRVQSTGWIRDHLSNRWEHWPRPMTGENPAHYPRVSADEELSGLTRHTLTYMPTMYGTFSKGRLVQIAFEWAESFISCDPPLGDPLGLRRIFSTQWIEKWARSRFNRVLGLGSTTRSSLPYHNMAPTTPTKTDELA